MSGVKFWRSWPRPNALDGQRIASLREQLAQTKHLARMFATPQKYRQRSVPGLSEFLDATSKLYRAIARVTECSVIVDSSKWPTYGFLLNLIPEIDVYVLHLVRDPRACAFSWTRGKDIEPGHPMGTQTAFNCTAYWVVWNPAIRYLWRQSEGRYRFLRYEDFVSRPRATIQGLAEFVGQSATHLPFTRRLHGDDGQDAHDFGQSGQVRQGARTTGSRRRVASQDAGRPTPSGHHDDVALAVEIRVFFLVRRCRARAHPLARTARVADRWAA